MRSRLLNQAGIYQCLQFAQQRHLVSLVAHDSGRGETPAAPEHRQRPEGRPCCAVEQLVTPIDRGPQRLPPDRPIPSSSAQQVEAAVQPCQ
jgi:hypothetical protein